MRTLRARLTRGVFNWRSRTIVVEGGGPPGGARAASVPHLRGERAARRRARRQCARERGVVVGVEWHAVERAHGELRRGEGMGGGGYTGTHGVRQDERARGGRRAGPR